MSAADDLADGWTAVEHGALDYGRDCAWRAASAAAQVGDAKTLEGVVEIASKLDAEQLRIYAQAALEDARAGTRPPSMFERLFTRDRRRN